MSERAHLSIGEVLGLLQKEFPDVTISKIRFLESQGLLDPERTPSGYRKFYEPDIARLRWILRQQRENFLPLKVIKDRLDETPPGEVPADTHPAAPVAPEPEPQPAPQPQPPRRPALFDTGPAEPAEREPERAPERAGLLDAGMSSVSLTADELAGASGLPTTALGELER